jgi:hypothetical protein
MANALSSNMGVIKMGSALLTLITLGALAFVINNDGVLHSCPGSHKGGSDGCTQA